MSQIIINEVSNNFTYSIGDNTYATIALPITSCWGPGFFDPESMYSDEEAATLDDKIALELEDVAWNHFPANQTGMESFVSTYRGPSSNYRMAKDFSYYMAITLMSAGYDVLVCRLCPGVRAQSPAIKITDSKGAAVTNATLTIKAKYPGTFGNQIISNLYKPTNRNYWNLVTYIKDSSGVKTAVENLTFVFDQENATDTVLHVDEVNSDYVEIVHQGDILDSYNFTVNGKDTKSGIALEGGTDKAAEDEALTGNALAGSMIKDAAQLALQRFYKGRTYNSTTMAEIAKYDYMTQLKTIGGLSDPDNTGKYTTSGTPTMTDTNKASNVKYREWVFRYVLDVYDLLKDKLAYNPNRVISPGWDDMDIESLEGSYISHDGALTVTDCVSPIHLKLMSVAYFSRCATAYLDIPKSLPRKDVYDESETHRGYAQMLALYEPDNSDFDTNGALYPTHSALFAPWGQYKYIGTAKYNVCPPSFMALLIQRSMVLNQSLQYEWIMPTTRSHNVNINKLAYKIPKKVLDVWQPTDEEGGVGLNVITNIPGMGVTLWGNATLFNNPPSTYQALRNLSTRHLVGAIRDVVYKAGIRITFRYNNSESYAAFHAAVTPLLDTMLNCGALEDYYVTMNHDLDALGMVKANSVIGKIYLVPAGVIEKITVDLIALPPGTDLSQFE